MDLKNNKYVNIGLVVTALGFTYFTASYLVPMALVTFTKAAPATTVSVNESRILGQKLLCKADGNDKCVVNVYILDSSDKGVAKKRVSMSGVTGIVASSASTDADGKAVFSMTSKVEGQFKLSADVEGVPLTQTISVTFRN